METEPFDDVALLYRIQEATARLKAQGNIVDDGIAELAQLLEATRNVPIGTLRDEMRVLFLPEETNAAIVLLVKEDNNGTCHRFSRSVRAIDAIRQLLEWI